MVCASGYIIHFCRHIIDGTRCFDFPQLTTHMMQATKEIIMLAIEIPIATLHFVAHESV